MPLVFGAVLAVASLLLAQASPVPSAQNSTPPSPLPATLAPVIPPPAASATPAYNFVYRATAPPATLSSTGPNPPEIDEIDLNDATIVTPGVLRVRVLTNNAIAVYAETFGRTVAIPQRQPGVFAYDGYIPSVPFYLRNRTYDVRFSASAGDGRTASVSLPLTLR